MKATITKNKVDRLQATERDAFIWDTDVQGFGVRCRPSGGKFYVLKTRADGHQRWLTIGRHGSPWTPKTARDEALRLLGLSVSGEDLVGERERMKHGDTVADLGKWFLKKYVAKNCKPSTAREYGERWSCSSTQHWAKSASVTLLGATLNGFMMT